MPSRNRHRPVGRLDRPGPRTTRTGSTRPAGPGDDPVGIVDRQLAVHGYLVLAAYGRLDHATAAALWAAVGVVGDGHAGVGQRDPGAVTIEAAIGRVALAISRLAGRPPYGDLLATTPRRCGRPAYCRGGAGRPPLPPASGVAGGSRRRLP